MWKRLVGIVILTCGVAAGLWMYSGQAREQKQQSQSQAAIPEDVCKEALSTYDLANRGAAHAINDEDRQKMLKVAADERQRVESCIAQKEGRPR